MLVHEFKYWKYIKWIHFNFLEKKMAIYKKSPEKYKDKKLSNSRFNSTINIEIFFKRKKKSK